MSARRQLGNIIVPAGVYPEKHEMETANALIMSGQDVVFISPSQTKGVRTPDIEFEGVDWEVKCPFGKSRWTIENQFKRARRQSQNIIIDARHVKIPVDKLLMTVQTLFERKSIRKLKLLMKDGRIVDFNK